ncbi:cell division protein ZapE [Cellulomonas bogoriensis]|uniref:ATPase n=1 Tax=Cellulomonas bogoriensis 69B4 = DSM 16987 TaxID=1386082 RepID=A0A0A0BZ56_9CELL|nr:cell division protein ZapE [Cellulomonas bogoriensis]KGM13215.1 ATPase [Cellulomonas bogoriensis 69B4 = DSM 16987]
MTSLPSLTSRHPQVPADDLLAGFVPPPHFADATFDSYRPDPDHPGQAQAREHARSLAERLQDPPRRRWWTRTTPAGPALYLDGGFGVGKTHLLAAVAHAVPEAAFGTFVEYTHLVGALGFGVTVRRLSRRPAVLIDEFELDDPGDTVLMSRLLRELNDAGVALVATSNTLPESLGEGRFAAEDFLREIQALSDRFEVVRVDGPDYRHRGAPHPEGGLPDVEVRDGASAGGGTVDTFEDLLHHLRTVHPSRYGALVQDVPVVGITAVAPLIDQADALRLVVLVDRLYDRDVPVLLGGVGTTGLFGDAMLRGGYRKKYLRALSRLTALAAAGRDQLPAST